MNREYHKWWSKNLDRDMELLVFGHSGEKVLVFPTRGGRFFEYEDLRMPKQLADKIEQGKLQLYCVDGIDGESFYCFWAHPSGRIQRYLAYEQYILKEVLPFMKKKNKNPVVVSHGCSLGAFHAANIAFRHPNKFNKLVAFSGRFDLTLNVEYFKDLFDGYYSEDVYFNTPTHFLPNLQCKKILKQLRAMDITLVIGEEDPFYDNNRALSDILRKQNIEHKLYVWGERAHRGYYWRRMAPLYL
ncbi:esterase [Catenovulum agarivorans DS-2]|uniref:Esterase n=1 Tax=Catenovulum agarivorans DS-2 TaxID=1328313 RepID=W7QWJ0_9ALTE|nr:alpha/beta hydrolase-fold protein [Catenovulum agarivorans]EWH09630.1 esterase [Catenovulum agarivorans DS-2]